jgi:hypothetical protein
MLVPACRVVRMPGPKGMKNEVITGHNR